MKTILAVLAIPFIFNFFGQQPRIPAEKRTAFCSGSITVVNGGSLAIQSVCVNRNDVWYSCASNVNLLNGQSRIFSSLQTPDYYFVDISFSGTPSSGYAVIYDSVYNYLDSYPLNTASAGTGVDFILPTCRNYIVKVQATLPILTLETAKGER